MLTQLTVFTPSIDESPLPFGAGSEETDLIQILNIDGLGPVDATVNTTQYGSVNGEFYSGYVVGKRNIVMTLRLNPDWSSYTYESLRQILYSYFMPGQQVRFLFQSTHLPKVQITGYVESFEPPLFSQEEIVTISIICPDPFFEAVNETAIQGTTKAIGDTFVLEIDYEGTVETGFLLDITVGTTLSGEVRLAKLNPTLNLFTVTAAVNSTTSLEISTEKGNKYANQLAVPGNAATSIMGAVSVGSVWLSLTQGTNQFQIQADTAGQKYTLRYWPKYGGL